MAKIRQVSAMGGDVWFVAFEPRNPVEVVMGSGPVIRVKARNYQEAVRRAKARLVRSRKR